MAARLRSYPARSLGVYAQASLGLVLALVLTFLGALPASAGDGTWTRLASLDWSYYGYSIAADPANSAVLLIGQSGYGGHTGIYRSDDRGKTWTEVACGRSVIVGDIQFAPQDSRVVYAWVGPNPPDPPHGRDRSPDRSGRNFLDEACSAFFAAHGRESSLGDGDFSTVNGELKEPTAGRLYQSLDGGKTWKQLPLPAKDMTFIRGVDLFLDPDDARVVYASGYYCKDQKDCKKATYRSSDQGKTWKQVPGVESRLKNVKLDHTRIWSDGDRLVNPLNQAEVFQSEGCSSIPGPCSAVMRSTDGGRTFSQLGSPLEHGSVASLALDRANPQTLYASLDGGEAYSLWAYTLPTRAESLPRSGDPLQPILPILAALAAALSLVGLRLRRRSSTEAV